MIGLLIPTLVENISTRKDRTVKIVLGTQELSPAKAGELFNLMNQVAMTYICPKGVSQSEIDQVDQASPNMEGKSQSQRIRNVLYKLYEQNNEGFKSFDDYYRSKTDKIIEHLKNKIES